MNHFKKIAGVLETHSLDAVLLTCEANRFYASGFHSSGTAGIRRPQPAMYGMRRSGKRAGNIPTPPLSTRSSKRNTSPAWGMRMNI